MHHLELLVTYCLTQSVEIIHPLREKVKVHYLQYIVNSPAVTVAL